MKRILCAIFSLFFLFSCSHHQSKTEPTTPHKNEASVNNKEFRAVWISYLDLQKFDFSTENSFTNNVKTSFKYIKDFGLNTVIVQVRPYADAIYKSEIFPWCKYVCKNEPQYDPLAIMTNIASDLGLAFHAWINPYRISADNDTKKLDSLSPAIKFIENNSSDVVIIDKGIFFNPASLPAQKIIIDGIKEILLNYEVDAIHIDDYFYPTTEIQFDAPDYEKYKKSGGTFSLDDWRRENVNSLISGIFSTIKSFDKEILFGISPGGNIEYNYNNLYADAKKWCENSGYVDYIIPQIYFGFENTTKPFCETLNSWAELAEESYIDIYCGLALYKCGTVDEFCADEKSKTEWLKNSDMIKRQIEYLRKNGVFRGFALFSLRNLSDVTNKNSEIEIQNIRNVL